MRSFLIKNMNDILCYFGKKANGLDMTFLTKIVNMQDKLEQIFPKERPYMGLKYRDVGTSLWSNHHLQNIRNILKTEKIEFDIRFDSGLDLMDINNLFQDQVEKMNFYK